MLDIMRRVHQYACHYAQFPALLTEIIPPSNGDARKNKSRLTVTMDFLYCFLVLKIVPRNYYLFGFHAKERREFKNYMDEFTSPFLKRRSYESLWDDRYSSLLTDKYIFHCLCRYNRIPVPDVYGIVVNGIVKQDGKELGEFMDREGIEQAILKPVRGRQGKGIYFALRCRDGIAMRPAFSNEALVKPLLPQGEFIVQQIIDQHPEFDRINPYCLNSIRVISLLTPDNRVKLLSAMVRTNAGKSPIDNFSRGGIVIGIDLEEGRLKRTGFMKDQQVITMTHHPITNLEFEGFRIPYWNEIKDMITKMQKIFSGLKAVGWDIAIAPHGPLVIEGNIEWGTSGIQAANGGLLTPENRALFAGHGLKFHD